MTNLDQFPRELMDLIVSHVATQDLFACTLVNSQFSASANPLLWNSVLVKHQRVARAFLYCLMKAKNPVGLWIRHINLPQDLDIKDNSLNILLKRVPNLVSCVIGNAKRIQEVSIQRFPRSCPRLKYLSLTSCSLTNSSFEILGKHCQHLTRLELWSCAGIQSDTISTFFVNSPLTTLVMAPFCDDRNPGIVAASASAAAAAERNKPTATAIDVTPLRHLKHYQLQDINSLFYYLDNILL